MTNENTELEAIVARFEKATLERLEATDARADDVDERIAALVEFTDTEENVEKTDEALRWLITVVDRYFSEGRNGTL